MQDGLQRERMVVDTVNQYQKL